MLLSASRFLCSARKSICQESRSVMRCWSRDPSFSDRMQLEDPVPMLTNKLIEDFPLVEGQHLGCNIQVGEVEQDAD